MITIISGTHREGNKSLLIAKEYLRILNKKGKEAQILDLRLLPERFIWDDMFGEKSEEGYALIEKYIAKADKFVFIAPEYNGSIPGVLKLLIDGVDPEMFKGKRAALTGVASGQFGNLRGLDDLTNILHHLKVEVCPVKIYIPAIYKMLDENNQINDNGLIDRIEIQFELL
jgi:NAD(P)H-dependent FMN reductase